MSLTEFVRWPRYEEYKEMFKEHLFVDKRNGGVLMVRMRTSGGARLWSAGCPTDTTRMKGRIQDDGWQDSQVENHRR